MWKRHSTTKRKIIAHLLAVRQTLLDVPLARAANDLQPLGEVQQQRGALQAHVRQVQQQRGAMQALVSQELWERGVQLMRQGQEQQQEAMIRVQYVAATKAKAAASLVAAQELFQEVQGAPFSEMSPFSEISSFL